MNEANLQGFLSRQRELGEDNQRLDEELSRLLEERQALETRVRNLETVVTSRLWETASSAEPTPAGVARVDIATSEVSAAGSDQERLAQLARTMGVDA